MRSALVILVCALVAYPVAAAKLVVESFGTDGPECGTELEPCRSISQAISVAQDGDRIVVGPGIYGDLNRDRVFGGPGEEAGEVGFGCRCMIRVDKPVVIVSKEGAEATVLDRDRIGNISDVKIYSSGAQVGDINKGFTIKGGNVAAVKIEEATSGITIAGNTIMNEASNGISVAGSGHTIFANRVIQRSPGMSVKGEGHWIAHNLIMLSGDEGLKILGGGDHVVEGNLVFGSRTVGIWVNQDAGYSASLKGNTIQGNGLEGVVVVRGNVTLYGNNIFGNDFSDEGAQRNCGVFLTRDVEWELRNNFWGSEEGPGSDPADRLCDQFGVSLVDDSFAQEPRPVAGPKP